MTMAQGGLFNGNEESTELFTFAANGKSQSKEAKYHRAYRSDPKNKDRINSQKKRRRTLKKEQELGSVSSMFQVPAESPAKVSQQAVGLENHPKTNNSSLSESCPETSCELNDSSRNYCQNDQMPVANRRTDSIKGKSNNLDIQHQAELLLEIKNCLKELSENIKPATQLMPVNNLEQQASVSRIANANTSKIPNTADLEKRDFLAGIFAQLAKLDGCAFIRNFPAAIALGYCAYEACKFVVAQTLPMYQSLKFPDPELACYGAISLAIGFSALSVISRSSLAKLFTAIIITYEVILVFAGSQANQSDLASEALRNNPEHYEASEYYAITKSDFDRYKTNFESNNSKMFHNAWYKKTYLEPAREKMGEAVAKLSSIEEKLGNKYAPSYWELVLKVLYRLSAVAFLMLLAKESIKRGVGALKVSNEETNELAV